MSVPGSTRTKKEKPKVKKDDPSLYPFQVEVGAGELPGEIYGHTTVVYEHYLYVFGGCNQKGIFSSDLYRYSLTRKRWKKVDALGTKPKGRHFHSAIVHENKMFVFGGKSNGYMNDLFYLDFGSMTWVTEDNISGKPPTKRYGHTAVVHGSAMYVYGGYDDFGYKSNEIFEYRLESKEWRKLDTDGDAPERFHHSALVHNGSMYIFGGLAGDKETTALLEYRFDTKKWARVQTIGKPADGRWGHSAVVCNGKMYILGGCDNVLNFKEVFKYNFESCRWSKTKGDGFEPRYFTTSVTYKDKVYIFAGRNIHNYCFNDLCTFSADIYRSRHPDTYLEDMGHLLNDKEFSDIRFCFPEEDNKTIFAHKSILAARCSGFRTMLRSGMKECVEGKIDICEVKFHIYHSFLMYIYSGQVTKLSTLEDYIDLLQLSDRYMLEHLKSLLQRQLKRHLTVTNVDNLFETAIKYKADELHDICIKYTAKYYDILSDKKSMNKELIAAARAIVDAQAMKVI